MRNFIVLMVFGLLFVVFQLMTGDSAKERELARQRLCRSNQNLIASLYESYYMDKAMDQIGKSGSNASTPGDIDLPTLKELMKKDWPANMKCPDGGEYSLVTVDDQKVPVCSVHGQLK
ncbi:MAG: hypothetical protein ACOYXC_06915 [Candidatus Rifleibacteriota bacterium]